MNLIKDRPIIFFDLETTGVNLLSDRIVEENRLTTLMITHNMGDAIKHGNRLIMMNEGHVIYDVRGEEKSRLEVKDLLARFEEASGNEFANDRMMLA